METKSIIAEKRTKKTSNHNKILLWIRNFFIIILLLALLIPASGLVYEKIGEYTDSQKFKPTGKIVEINGHDMHIFAQGKGNCTVVFASGSGIPSPYADFYPLYNEIAKHARIAVYERPGYGWSKTAKTPRDIDTITSEIHELLQKSGEKPPYILVGSSLASLEIIRFSQLYKDEVKGVIALDAGNPNYYAHETIEDSAFSSLKLKSILSDFGVMRLLFNHVPSFYQAAYAPRNSLSHLPKELRELDKAMYLRNMVNKNKIDESKNMKTNALKVVSNGHIGEIPLTILTSESEAKDSKWKKSQEDFKNWSKNSKQIIVKGTNHNMHQFAPKIINNVILEAISKIK